MQPDFDLTFGQLSQQFKDSLDSRTLSFAPQLVVLDMITDEATSTASGNDLQHDIVNPLVIDDYSAYGEQVDY